MSSWGQGWQQLAPHQASLVVAHCLCVSFHKVEHPLFPRLHLARIVDAVGADQCVVVEDAEDPECLRRRFLSRLAWVSPLFWSANPRVVEAVSSWMNEPSHTVGWSLFDDGSMSPPQWPTMEGQSPWGSNLLIEGFRGELRAVVEAGGAAGCGVDWMVEKMEDMNRAAANKRWSEELAWPRRPVFCPARWWGARWAREGESAESGERAELVRALEEDARRAEVGEVEQMEEGETAVKEVVVGPQSVDASAQGGASGDLMWGDACPAPGGGDGPALAATVAGKTGRPKHRARARERRRAAKAQEREEARLAQLDEAATREDEERREAVAVRKREEAARRKEEAEVRRRREVELRRQREAEQRRLREAERARREALNRQKFEVFRARRNLEEQVGLMRQRERELATRGFPAGRGQSISGPARSQPVPGPARGQSRPGLVRGQFRPGPVRGGRGSVVRGGVAGRRGGLPVRSQASPPDPQPSLADVLGAVQAVSERLAAVEQREPSLLLSSASGAGAPVASSTPAPVRALRQGVVASSVPAPQFGAVDYRVTEGSVPAVQGVLEPALPMASGQSLLDSALTHSVSEVPLL